MPPSTVVFRAGTRADLPAIVALLADDPVGAGREVAADPLPEAYTSAFEAIEADPGNELLVADREGSVAAVLQITWIPGLTRTGGTRALIEGVRVARDARGKGLGHLLLERAIAMARERGCTLVQLTTDKTRTDAHRFYESLLRVASLRGHPRGPAALAPLRAHTRSGWQLGPGREPPSSAMMKLIDRKGWCRPTGVAHGGRLTPRVRVARHLRRRQRRVLGATPLPPARPLPPRSASTLRAWPRPATPLIVSVQSS
jgi:GNAT superfamily N-acetyltransferase